MKRLPCLSAALLLALSAAAARADVINFSGLGTNNVHNAPEAPIPDGYAGFDWHNFSSLNTQNDPNATPSGYSNANTDSASASVGFNLFGNPASITRPTTFSFYGAFFTAAWKDHLYVEVEGLRQGSVLYDATFAIDSTKPTFESFADVGIDELKFRSFAGPGTTVHGWIPGKPSSHPPRNQVAVDDLIYLPGPIADPAALVSVQGGPAGAAPEPTGLVLLAVGGAAAAAAWGRRRPAAG